MSFAAVVDNPKTPASAFLTQGSLGAARALSKIANDNRESKLIQNAFDPNKRYSPMETAQKLANLDVDPEKKKFLWEALKLNQVSDLKEKEIGAKTTQALLKAQAGDMKKVREGEQALKTAKQLGLVNPKKEGFTEEDFRNMSPKDVRELYKTQHPKGAHSDVGITPEQKDAIRRARAVPGFNEMDETEQLDVLLENNVSAENADKIIKARSTQLDRKGEQFEKDYKAQEDFINSTTNSYVAWETNTKPRLLAMQDLNKDDELLSAKQEAFLSALGIPIGALDKPGSELYEKLSQDLLKGLPETYGNRILKVEVENFLQTIPRLSNSKDGRRMIASQLLKLGEMKKVFYDEMRRKQQQVLQKKEIPKDFQQSVFDNIKPQIDQINQDFVQMLSVKAVPPNTVPFFNPTGGISFVPNTPDAIKWAEENKGRRIW